ncbi:MAG: hypothetical protein WD469_00045 [Paenibacillaceae bacterium]
MKKVTIAIVLAASLLTACGKSDSSMDYHLLLPVLSRWMSWKDWRMHIGRHHNGPNRPQFLYD